MNKSVLLWLLLAGFIAASSVNAEDLAASSAIAHKTATQVVDSKNHVVGTLFALPYRTAALVEFNGTFYLLPVTAQGFFDSSASISYFFADSNCTGQAAIQVNPNVVPLYADGASANPSVGVENGVLYFPQNPISQFSYASAGSGVSPADAVTDCGNVAGEATAGLLGTFNLSSLGFVPPFKLK
jgi:hypothetical protein